MGNYEHITFGSCSDTNILRNFVCMRNAVQYINHRDTTTLRFVAGLSPLVPFLPPFICRRRGGRLIWREQDLQRSVNKTPKGEPKKVDTLGKIIWRKLKTTNICALSPDDRSLTTSSQYANVRYTSQRVRFDFILLPFLSRLFLRS